MKHYDASEWIGYVENRLPEEQRAGMEDHLYRCDQCLGLYMTSLEAIPTPSLMETNTEPLTDELLQIIFSGERGTPDAHPIRTRWKKSVEGWLQKPFLLYTAAAMLTIVLMSTGFFQMVSDGASRMEKKASQPIENSWTKELMQRTVSMLDTMDPKEDSERTARNQQ